MQAQQRMQSSILVATLSLIEMAAVGHTLAHVPQTSHVPSLVKGYLILTTHLQTPGSHIKQ